MTSALGPQPRSPDPRAGVVANLAHNSATAPEAARLPLPGSLPKARILVVEDHPFVREGVIRLINRQTDLCCCGESDTVAMTPAITAREKPDLILLDLHLKDGLSLELIEPLLQEFPSSAVLVLSQSDEVSTAERALRAGARGYVVKKDATEEVLGAIRDVLRGTVYISPALATRLVCKLLRS